MTIVTKQNSICIKTVQLMGERAAPCEGDHTELEVQVEIVSSVTFEILGIGRGLR